MRSSVTVASQRRAAGRREASCIVPINPCRCRVRPPQVFDFQAWEGHRSTTRYSRHLLGMFRCVCMCVLANVGKTDFCCGGRLLLLKFLARSAPTAQPPPIRPRPGAARASSGAWRGRCCLSPRSRRPWWLTSRCGRCAQSRARSLSLAISHSVRPPGASSANPVVARGLALLLRAPLAPAPAGGHRPFLSLTAAPPPPLLPRMIGRRACCRPRCRPCSWPAGSRLGSQALRYRCCWCSAQTPGGGSLFCFSLFKN